MKATEKKVRRTAALLMVLVLMAQLFGGAAIAETVGTAEEAVPVVEDPAMVAAEDRVSYYNYLQLHSDKEHPDEECPVELQLFTEEVEGSTTLYQNQEGSAEGIAISNESRDVTFTAYVPVSGMYNIRIKYMADADYTRQIRFEMRVDNQVPFTEAYSCVLSRSFRNEEIIQDDEGNDIRPRAEQLSVWRTQYLRDLTGISGNLQFYLEEGTHTLTFCFERTPMLIEEITLCQEPVLIDYQDYLAVHSQLGHEVTEDVQLIVQAEKYYMQSASTLWPDTDYSSPLTQPFDYVLTRMNMGGGSQWKAPGEWISWKIEVPEDGFYNIGVKYKQGYLDGLFSSRTLYIDGEIPFKELGAVRFDYTVTWKNQELGNGVEPYSIYLTKGEHILTMECVMGEMEGPMNVLQDVATRLNELYLSIIMITSSEPDPYRDYYLSTLLPNLSSDLKACAQTLRDEADHLISVVGTKGEQTAYFEDIAYNLESYANNIRDLTYRSRLTNLKNDISSLAAKITEYKEQAMDIDYITVSSPNMEMPRVKLNAWEWVVYQVKSFVASFEDDHKSGISTQNRVTEDGRPIITVWMGGGNTQFEIMQRMVDDLFTPQTGIEVELVLGGIGLVNATLTNVAPDLFMGVGDVVDMAIRGALEPLESYPGFDEVTSKYIEGINIPNTLEGHVYAITLGGGGAAMFVRTDIFEALELEVPETWDELLDLAQILQRNNMNIGIAPSFMTLLYQNGGAVYADDRKSVRLDEDVAINAMKQHAEYYTKYGFPMQFDFMTQFRSGEMPIAMQGTGVSLNLKYLAPEITGLWKMYKLPETELPDGTRVGTQPVMSEGGGIGIPRVSQNKEAAWEFIKWWASSEAQLRWSLDLEGALGYTARQSTANLEIIDQLGWTDEELEVLLYNAEQLEFLPVVPGDYYVQRGINFTISDAYNTSDNVREIMEEWTTKMNEEITRKRKEFYENNGELIVK